MRQSIFDKMNTSEINYSQEMLRVHRFFSEEKIIIVDRAEGFSYEYLPIENYINEFLFFNWEHRGTFLSTHDLRAELHISKKEIVNNNIDIMLNYFEFVINMTNLLRTVEDLNFDEKYLVVMLENIITILDRLNFELVDIKGCSIIVEKSPSTTAISEIHEDISDRVIEYKRFDLKGNLDKKREILQLLSNKFEGIKSNLKENNYSYIINEASGLLNNLNIRHNNYEGQNANERVLNMDAEELECWYDKTYDLILLSLMINHYLSYKSHIKNLNKELKSGV